MSNQVSSTACVRCSMCLGPGVPMNVLPANRVLAGGLPAANMMDNKPMLNVPSMGMCNSPMNPTVIAATAAAMGVPTPGPCVPALVAPWVPGAPDILIGGMPTITKDSVLTCAYGGVISVVVPGQFTVLDK